MRLVPSHIKAVEEVLTNGDFETAKDAAKAVIRALDDRRADDVSHVVVRQYVSKVDGQAMYMGYGPFSNLGDAERAVEKNHVGLAGFGTVAIVPLRSEKSQLAKLKEIDDFSAHSGGNVWKYVKEIRNG